jgi:hypothetical protein
MSVRIRPAWPGDGDGMARVWLTAGAYYADLDPAHFQLEAAESWGRDHDAVVARLHTYPGSPISVPFYERHMGYQRRSILFQKPLS